MPKPKGSRTWLVATLVGVVALLGGFVFASGGVGPALSKVGLAPAPAPSPSIPTVAAPTAEKTAAPEPTASASPPSAEPSASASTSASAAATTTAAPTLTAAPGPATPRAPTTSTRPSEPAAPKPASPTPEPTPTPAEESESPSSGSSGAAFDAGAAKTALTAAAANASSCKTADGPTGAGRVSITFAPSGRPTSVAVTGDVAGSSVGSCVAKLFRQTRVPAFSGDPVTVAKGFTVE